MNSRVSPQATLAIAVATVAMAGASLLASSAHAGSLTVNDTDGSHWTVVEDPTEDSPGFLLRRASADNRPDLRFGREGQTTFMLSATNDPPASVRVDSTRRIWMVGSSISGNQPQPVIERFLADGNVDLRWGVQGKVQLSPGGLAIQPKDLLPLSDGSVLVAGEVSSGQASSGQAPRAVVFHLKADGALDRSFGNGGVWQRAGDADTASTATSLAASADGVTAVAIAARGTKPGAELWSLNDTPPKLILHKPLDENSDGEDLRTAWSQDHWALNSSGGPTTIVLPALLTNHPAAAASEPAPAASDLGQGGFNPFEDTAASAPAAAADADDGLPWAWIGLGAIVVAGFGAFFFKRRRASRTVLKAGVRR